MCLCHKNYINHNIFISISVKMVYNIVMFPEVYCQYDYFKTKLYFS
jgi:hypothetical protein